MKRGLLVLATLAMACGGLSVGDFQTQANAAKACDPVTDRCVLAGASKCLCPTAVNASFAAGIDSAAKDVGCGGAMVQCPLALNPRCVAGRCVTDTQ